MIQSIRTSRFSKVISSYLAIQLILTVVQPTNLYALTGGPSQPEFESFTPIGTSDMVNLASGDFNYNIPIMDVGGYPINLSYDSGITMDQEASWVGLGWNLNIGQINRQVRGIPDDFNGDAMKYENNLKDNNTVGANVYGHFAAAGNDIPVNLGVGLGVSYNNYSGFSYSSTHGVSFEMSNNVSVGMNMTNSSTEGVSVSPSLTLSSDEMGADKYKLNAAIGTSFNSRQGLTSLSISPSLTRVYNKKGVEKSNKQRTLVGASGTKSFLPMSFTPTKRNKLLNYNVAANGSVGFEVWGGEAQAEMYIYGSQQKLAEKISNERAFGFNFTENASRDDILDFNKENDRVVTKNINVLPITNYTYDLYSISGQGIGGMYQPQRSQVGYVFDKYVKDESIDGSLGVEIGVPAYAHVGVEFRASPSTSSTGLWADSNHARSNFIENPNTNNKAYEKVFYKSIGELNLDHEINILRSKLGDEEPVKLQLEGSDFDKKTVAGKYLFGSGSELMESTEAFQNDIVRRDQRLLRNQAIQKITKSEAEDLYANYDGDLKPEINEAAQAHHNVETRIVKPDGSTYIFGQPAYNLTKKETTFNATGLPVLTNGGGNSTAPLISEELIQYNPGSDNSIGNSRGTDHYFNRITTPAYVHTFLLTEVLSSDYEDLTGDGPTDDDLGAYTKIHYDKEANNYNWRVPFHTNSATSNRGFNSLKKDDMGNYVYGEKELFYAKKIETKTHVAIFDLKERNDGYGVIDENGGLSTGNKMRQINTIKLYAKPEYLANQVLLDDNDPSNDPVQPIKTAHFEYDYSLCKGVPNNNTQDNSVDINEATDEGGKLTLKKVYFTYRGSNMGKYTPYAFKYDNINPDYHVKAYNLWGNYKDVPTDTSEPTTAEFPYVNQSDRAQENENAKAWTMSAIDLPSGGKIEMSYEADDYSHVQNKKAMQMFKVRGFNKNNTLNKADYNNRLYDNGDNGKKYMLIELPNETTGNVPTTEEFIENYLSEIINDPIFFKFQLQMNRSKADSFDFVSGYFTIDTADTINVFSDNGKVYGVIPVNRVDLNKSRLDDNGENPISKAGWYFGRQYLNRYVYNDTEDDLNFDVLQLATTIVGQVGAMFDLFVGPNRELKMKGCAQHFNDKKSWIRLQNPTDSKVGGGIRVTQIEMFDQWDLMTDNNDSPNSDLYKMTYGQSYDYSLGDGTSSGVATFEPFGSKENPFVEPFYDGVEKDRLLAPQQQNFTEKPFGISFFPSPTVTYSRVTVKNLEKDNPESNEEVLSKTGFVVNEFYTSKDYPTIAKHTPLGSPNPLNEPSTGVSILQSIFGLNFVTLQRMSMSQGFMVITNDMNGKSKTQLVYPESAEDDQIPTPISRVEYYYNTTEDNQLYNEVPVVHPDGSISKETIGVDYSVVNDFKESKSNLQTYGADINLAVIPLGPFPLALVGVTPQIAVHDTKLRTATTTKAIHKTSFLVEKRAYDLGAEVTTKNLAWDSETGQVILTETANEYKDVYYNFNYPAYWYYTSMGAAANNLGVELELNPPSNGAYTYSGASTYLTNGDQVLFASDPNNAEDNDTAVIAWVVDLNGNQFSLIDRHGQYVELEEISKAKVIRSGYKNVQSGNMASITLMHNPIANPDYNPNTDPETEEFLGAIEASTFDANTYDKKKIINASAVKYKDEWLSQCECGMPELTFDELGNIVYDYGSANAFNPYLYNIKGEWRADKSYAYLTGRYNDDTQYNPRHEGFFKDFRAFYKPDQENGWYIDEPEDPNEWKWQFASEVTQYSPYGTELENKDALGRYSAAQYGYNYKLPVAVASNSQYREIGFDGFEDYVDKDCEEDHFSFRNVQTEGNENNNQNNSYNSTTNPITALESHTGNYSYALNANQTVYMQTTVAEDCESISTSHLLADLINALLDMSMSGAIPTDGSCFTPNELTDLYEHITLPSEFGGVTPQICNFVYANNQPTEDGNYRDYMQFSFTPNPVNNTMPYGSGPYDVFVLLLDGMNDSNSWPHEVEEINPGNLSSVNPEFTVGGILYGGVNDNGDETELRSNYYRYIEFIDEERCLPCTSFAPIHQKEYVISAWVKEDTSNSGTTPEDLLNAQPLSYANPRLNVKYANFDQGEFTQHVSLAPSGKIIDGWQRIQGVFNMPSNATMLRIELENQGENNVYFDDVRVLPFNGNLKSFVYDKENYRLMSELDENNYATFYEYDNEGGLIRVKKETERGVMTIQETRSGTFISKQQ